MKMANPSRFQWASAFNTWAIEGYAPNTYTWPAPASVNIASPYDASFYSFRTNAPLYINDQGTPANSEITTPTATSQYGFTPGALSHTHASFQIQSGTAGLQEAINAQGGGTAAHPVLILLHNQFFAAAVSIGT